MIHKFFLVIALSSFIFTYGQTLKKQHQALLKNSNIYSEHIYVTSVEMSKTHKSMNKASIFHNENTFSILNKKSNFLVHTKAVLEVKKSRLLVLLVHYCNKAKLGYGIQFKSEKITVIADNNNKERISRQIKKYKLSLCQAAKAYIKSPNSNHCFNLASEFLDLGFALMVPPSKSGILSIRGEKKRSQGWHFCGPTLNHFHLRKTFKGITITRIVIKYYQGSQWQGGLGGSIVATGEGTDTVDISLVNPSWGGNGVGTFWKGGSSIYYVD